MAASPEPAVKRHRFWIVIVAAVAVAAAAAFDWSRPANEQWSVRLFDHAVIGTYRTYFQPVTHRFIVCRFSPTCSAYGQMAIYAHGFPKGLWLMTKRIVRCNPWTKGGIDLVPPPRQQAPAAPPNEK
jgi:hypothetical protein